MPRLWHFAQVRQLMWEWNEQLQCMLRFTHLTSLLLLLPQLVCVCCSIQAHRGTSYNHHIWIEFVYHVFQSPVFHDIDDSLSVPHNEQWYVSFHEDASVGVKHIAWTCELWSHSPMLSSLLYGSLSLHNVVCCVSSDIGWKRYGWQYQSKTRSRNRTTSSIYDRSWNRRDAERIHQHLSLYVSMKWGQMGMRVHSPHFLFSFVWYLSS